MNPIEHLNWSSNKKVSARHETIINQYRKLIGNHSLPKSQQYWTLAANQTDDHGNLLHGGELDQIITTGLITPKQYIGVDIDEQTIAKNKSITNGAQFIHGNFYSELVKAHNNHTLNAGIINFDTLNMAMRGSVDFSNIMYLLSLKKSTNIMLVGNFILRHRCIQDSMPVDIIQELEKQPKFQFSIKKRNWKSSYEIYTYNGSGITKATWMATIIFVLK
jgi:hypothetical protein